MFLFVFICLLVEQQSILGLPADIVLVNSQKSMWSAAVAHLIVTNGYFSIYSRLVGLHDLVVRVFVGEEIKSTSSSRYTKGGQTIQRYGDRMVSLF